MLHQLDRLLTIVVTATLTSAVWIVAGGTIMQQANFASGGEAPQSAANASRGVQQSDRQLAGRSVMAPARGATLVVPVVGKTAADLTDTFTQARGGGTRVHDAIDVMAAEGTPIIAAAPGRIEKLFTSKAGGLTIYVRSPDQRTIYYYAHLRNYAPGLREGQTVTAGQRLGSVGHTGNADPAGPHLHFAVLQTHPGAKWSEPATAINPYPLLGGK